GLIGVGLFASRTAWVTISLANPLRDRVLVLGVSRSARKLLDLQSTGSYPFSVLGFLDDSPDVHDMLPREAELLGKSNDLLSLVEEVQPDIIVVAVTRTSGAFPAKELLECRLRGIRVEDWLTFYEKQTGKILVSELRPSWLVFSDGFVSSHLTQIHKR